MKDSFLSFLSAGLSGGENTPYVRKIRFLNISCIILALFTHALIFKHYSENLSYLGLLDIAILSVILIILVFLRSTKNIEGASDLFLLLLVNISQYFLITGVVQDFAIIWIFSFPVIAFILKGEKRALIWSLAMLGGLIATFMTDIIGLIQLQYNFGTMLYISILFSFFTLLVYYLVNTNRIGEKILAQKSNDLYKTNLQLSREVRDRQETELILKQENVRDEVIFSSIAEGMVVFDQDFVIVMLNNTAIRLLNLPDTIIGKDLYDHIHLWNEDRKRIPRGHDLIAKAFHTKESQISRELLIGTSAEKAIQVNLTVSPIVLYQKVVGGIITFRDIREEKEIDRMKTEFISLASHQLRTPLTAMKWFLEMLLNEEIGSLTQEQKDHIKNISDSNEKEIALVNALLNISRIESGRIFIDPVPMQLNELIQEVCNSQVKNIEDKKLKLVLELAPSVPQIPLDQKLMREVITNLVTNAIKYTPNDGTITISTHADDKKITLTVHDTGYGIPEKEQARIFERFFRASNVVKIVTEGTGLGLYLVKKILDTSGGKISLKSQENHGTTFEVTLPLKGMVRKKGEVNLT